MLPESKCTRCESREYSVFKNTCSETLDQVSNEKVSLHFKKRDIIFKEGEQVKGFYCIKSGVVRRFKKPSTGKELTFSIKSKGHWLGFREIVSDIDYNNSTVCLENVEICFIPRNTVEKLIKSDADFQLEVMKYLANEWRVMENDALSKGTKQVHSRLAELLITLYGISDQKAPEIYIKLSREVMATCIGTSTETLIRAISDFRDRDWIRIDENKIDIRNLPALYQLADS